MPPPAVPLPAMPAYPEPPSARSYGVPTGQAWPGIDGGRGSGRTPKSPPHAPERTSICSDNCESGAADTVASEHDDCPFPAGTRVRHAQWGEGQVLRVEDDRVVVLFDGVGYKTLSAQLALDNDLLEPAAD